jgi:integrase
MKEELFPQTCRLWYIYARLRREELCWLQESDVDFSAGIHGMIRVRAKTVDDKSWEPKTKVNRVVPISSNLKIYLEKYPIPGVEGNGIFQHQMENVGTRTIFPAI